MTDQVWWYATRAAGLMTWATAMTSVILGLSLSLASARAAQPTGPLSRVLRRVSPSKPWILDVHRFVGGLSVAFLVIHMVTLWADSFVEFGPTELFVPFTSEWRPVATAFGVVAAWLLAGVEMTSLLKKFLPDRVWHGVHLGAYLVAVFGTVHAITAGSDVGNPIVAFIGMMMIALVVGLTVIRVALLRRGPSVGDANARAEMLSKARAAREADPETLESVASALSDLDAPSYTQPASDQRPIEPDPVPSALQGAAPTPPSPRQPVPIPAALQGPASLPARDSTRPPAPSHRQPSPAAAAPDQRHLPPPALRGPSTATDRLADRLAEASNRSSN